MIAKRILVVDDDRTHRAALVRGLTDEGYLVEVASNPSNCMTKMRARRFDAVLVDIVMPHGAEFSRADTQAGMKTGVALVRWIRQKYPKVPVAGLTVAPDSALSEWFSRNAHGLWPKALGTDDISRLARWLDRLLRLRRTRSAIRTFIVHGHADADIRVLKTLITRDLRLPEPVVLNERPDLGRTVLEKFEETAADVDLVFVLLTPDDVGRLRTRAEIDRWRSRQNVIFELGYFFGCLQRRTGRIVLLHRGPLELPSDIAGIAYVDISKGVSSAKRAIQLAVESVRIRRS